MSYQGHSNFLCLFSGLYLLIFSLAIRHMLYFHRSLVPRAAFILLCSVFSGITVLQLHACVSIICQQEEQFFFCSFSHLGDRN